MPEDIEQHLKKYMTLTDIKIDSLVIKSGSLVFLYASEFYLTLILENSVTIQIKDAEQVLKLKKNFDTYFAPYEVYEDSISYGSELNLVTKKGVLPYSVEDITFENNGTTYVTLRLKAL